MKNTVSVFYANAAEAAAQSKRSIDYVLEKAKVTEGVNKANPHRQNQRFCHLPMGEALPSVDYQYLTKKRTACEK